jgi:DNA polymerase V
VFDAELAGRPVVVLSNNDGNIIARSPEAKEIGVEMGAPAHELKDFFREKGVHVFSSNYSLYADMSWRVMGTLAQFSDDLQVYSIDEAFFRCRPTERESLTEYGHRVRRTVKRWTGIPIGVGIGATKTLAKLGNKAAKKDSKYDGVLDLATLDLDALLDDTLCEKIWGIGPARAQKLKKCGIENARQLRDMDDGAAKKLLGVLGLRTCYELRGIPCIEFTNPTPARKTFICSRAFGRPVESLKELKEAISMHAARAGEKLRRDDLAAGYIEVFVSTNPFGQGPMYSASRGVRLGVATSFTPHLILAAEKLVERIYKTGFKYHKSGVVVSRIERQGEQQLPLFSAVPDLEREAAEMEARDRNKRAGGDTGLVPSWEMRREHLSPAWTTDWDTLPEAVVDEG